MLMIKCNFNDTNILMAPVQQLIRTRNQKRNSLAHITLLSKKGSESKEPNIANTRIIM